MAPFRSQVSRSGSVFEGVFIPKKLMIKREVKEEEDERPMRKEIKLELEEDDMDTDEELIKASVQRQARRSVAPTPAPSGGKHRVKKETKPTLLYNFAGNTNSFDVQPARFATDEEVRRIYQQSTTFARKDLGGAEQAAFAIHAARWGVRLCPRPSSNTGLSVDGTPFLYNIYPHLVPKLRKHVEEFGSVPVFVPLGDALWKYGGKFRPVWLPEMDYQKYKPIKIDGGGSAHPLLPLDVQRANRDAIQRWSPALLEKHILGWKDYQDWEPEQPEDLDLLSLPMEFVGDIRQEEM